MPDETVGRARLARRVPLVLIGLLLLAGVAAAHGEQGHSQGEQLPFAAASFCGIAVAAVGVLGERRSLFSSRRLVDTIVLGGSLLAVGGFVGLQLL